MAKHEERSEFTSAAAAGGSVAVAAIPLQGPPPPLTPARERWFYARRELCPRLHLRRSNPRRTVVKDFKLLVHYVLDVYECSEDDLNALEEQAGKELLQNVVTGERQLRGAATEAEAAHNDAKKEFSSAKQSAADAAININKANAEGKEAVEHGKAKAERTAELVDVSLVDASLIARDITEAIASFDVNRAKRSLRRRAVQEVDKKATELLKNAKSSDTAVALSAGKASAEAEAGSVVVAAGRASATAAAGKALEAAREAKIGARSTEVKRVAKRALDSQERLLPLLKQHIKQSTMITRRTGPAVTDFLLKRACRQLEKRGKPEVLPNLIQKLRTEANGIVPEEFTAVKREVQAAVLSLRNTVAKVQKRLADFHKKLMQVAGTLFVLGNLFTQLYDRVLAKDAEIGADGGPEENSSYAAIEYAIVINLVTQIPIVAVGLYVALGELGRDVAKNVRNCTSAAMRGCRRARPGAYRNALWSPCLRKTSAAGKDLEYREMDLG
eukprot:g299.t1